MRTLLFVCTGNMCRSPMAQGLALFRIGPQEDFRVKSAGLAAGEGSPYSDYAVRAMAEIGIDISKGRTAPLTAAIVREADFIFVMTQAQKEIVEAENPMAAEKTFLVTEFERSPGGAEDVMDPVGMPLSVYRETRDRLQRALGPLLEFVRNQDAIG